MTRPSVVYFGPDGGTRNVNNPKIYIRALLYATAKRGRVIESMHAAINRNETRQHFNIWVHGDEKLTRGGGMYVGEEGVVCSHHFLLPQDATGFGFIEGDYRLEIFARVIGDTEDTKLFSETFKVDQRTSEKMRSASNGVYFDWGPDSLRYTSAVEPVRPRAPMKHEPYTDSDWERAIGLNNR